MPKTPPETDERLLEARTCVRLTSVLSFAAEPSALDPTTSDTTVSWNVRVGPGCKALRIRLNGVAVPPQGRRRFTQFDAETYRLTAHMGVVSRPLASLRVGYDTSSCEQLLWSEDQVRDLVTEQLEAFIEKDPNLSLRRAPQIDITSRGIEVAVRVNREIDAFPDLKVDLDFVLARYRSFSIVPIQGVGLACVVG